MFLLLRRFFHASPRAAGKFTTTKKHRGSLSAKHMPKDWYKGRGARSLGRHTRKGGFRLDRARVPQLVMPDAAADGASQQQPLLPYVSKLTPLIKTPPPSYEALLEKMKQGMKK